MAKLPKQVTLFDRDKFAKWRGEWKGMPEFIQEDLESRKSIVVHFANLEDMEAFSKLIGQRVTLRTRSIWYPEAEIGHFANNRYADES